MRKVRRYWESIDVFWYKNHGFFWNYITEHLKAETKFFVIETTKGQMQIFHVEKSFALVKGAPF